MVVRRLYPRVAWVEELFLLTRRIVIRIGRNKEGRNDASFPIGISPLEDAKQGKQGAVAEEATTTAIGASTKNIVVPAANPTPVD